MSENLTHVNTESIHYHELFAISICKHVLQCALNKGAFVKVLQKAVEVGDIAVDALKGRVETPHNAAVAFSNLIINIQQYLGNKMVSLSIF